MKKTEKKPKKKLHALGHIPSYLNRHVVKDNGGKRNLFSLQDHMSRDQRKPSLSYAEPQSNSPHWLMKVNNTKSHKQPNGKGPQMHPHLQNVRNSGNKPSSLLWGPNMVTNGHPASSLVSNSHNNTGLAHRNPGISGLQHLNTQNYTSMLTPVMAPTKGNMRHKGGMESPFKQQKSPNPPKFAVNGVSNPTVPRNRKGTKKHR
eukprot:gb/GECG01001203.1/.p1 GENE.gb/GECG01001203.1/~~gb/GECG01001203.1/.p1  ORF type:complete len:203 (+),score=18.73 gb/GECG01001203.1/:1-609(+)